MLYLTYAMMFLHTFLGIILIGIILLQRGRGGGLVGALGGMGGQSFMGAKAGDVFTKITVVIATIWIVVGCICVLLTSNTKSTRMKFGGSEEVKKAEPLDGAESKKGDSEVPPGPGNPPPGKSEENKTDDKTEKGTKPEDPAATTEKPAATGKPAEKPDSPEKSETPEKPAPEKSDKPATPEKTDTPKEPEGAAKDSPEKKE